jgi:hypothetical protein
MIEFIKIALAILLGMAVLVKVIIPLLTMIVAALCTVFGLRSRSTRRRLW